jgi:CBS domain-containing protein
MRPNLRTDLPAVPTIADLVPITEIMTKELTSAQRDESIERVIQLMLRNRIGCLPVVEERGRPIGMITKLDLVEQLLEPAHRGALPPPEAAPPNSANELMMPIAITLGERASVAHAAAMMHSEDVHHVPIVDDFGALVGIVSSMDIVRWLAANDGFAR